MRPAEAAARIREVALSLPEAYEDEPWGDPVFKVAGNRMFAAMSADEAALRLTVKLTAEEREIASLLPYVSKARYVGRYGWVTAEVTDEETLEAVLEWLRESSGNRRHGRVGGFAGDAAGRVWLKAPAHLRSAVEADE